MSVNAPAIVEKRAAILTLSRARSAFLPHVARPLFSLVELADFVRNNNLAQVSNQPGHKNNNVLPFDRSSGKDRAAV